MGSKCNLKENSKSYDAIKMEEIIILFYVAFKTVGL